MRILILILLCFNLSAQKDYEKHYMVSVTFLHLLTAYTGTVAMQYDTTNNKLYIYNGGWKSVTLA